MNKSPPLFRKSILLVFGALSLVACGGGANQAAVDACKAEVLSKIEGKMGELNESDMLANARQLEDGNVQVDSAIVFRRGTDQENSQTFNCTVAPDDSGNFTRVVRMSINW